MARILNDGVSLPIVVMMIGPITQDAWRNCLNVVGNLFLAEGYDFRTEAQKANDIRQKLARIQAGRALS
jgi:hypothetical protein